MFHDIIHIYKKVSKMIVQIKLMLVILIFISSVLFEFYLTQKSSRLGSRELYQQDFLSMMQLDAGVLQMFWSPGCIQWPGCRHRDHRSRNVASPPAAARLLPRPPGSGRPLLPAGDSCWPTPAQVEEFAASLTQVTSSLRHAASSRA